MPTVAQSKPEDLLPAAQVRIRYGVSDMSIHRWLKDETLSFPQPLRINNRRYWRIADLQAFEARQASKQKAA